MTKEILNINEIINKNCCFDLQFRKDTRHERVGSPTYYRWKVQFVVTLPKEKVKILKKIKNDLSCGSITIKKNQARFSVQKISDINDYIIAFFKKSKMKNEDKRDFELWQKAVKIIYANKGKYISKWENNDLLCLIQIHKTMSKYKNHPRQSKWMEVIKLIVKTK